MKSKRHITRKTRNIPPRYNNFIWAARIITDLLALSYLVLLLHFYFKLF